MTGLPSPFHNSPGDTLREISASDIEKQCGIPSERWRPVKGHNHSALPNYSFTTTPLTLRFQHVTTSDARSISNHHTILFEAHGWMPWLIHTAEALHEGVTRGSTVTVLLVSFSGTIPLPATRQTLFGSSRYGLWRTRQLRGRQIDQQP